MSRTDIQQMYKAVIGVGILARRWGRVFSFGVLEQTLLSGSSFLFTALIAKTLGATQFGWFSIAWSLLMLLEAGGWGLFGDAVPSTAERIRRTLWPEFRYSFLFISAAFSVLLFTADLITALGVGFFNSGLAWLLVAVGIAFVALRFQNSVRRLYYLDGLRKEAARAAVVNVLMLFGISFVMVETETVSPATALLCMACANTASAALYFIQGSMVRRTDRQLIMWAASRLWRTGRWLLISSEMSWLGNFGVIPLVGIMLGVEASGTLRAIQTLVVPMTQMNNVILSIIIPKAAAEVRRDRTTSWWALATKTMVILAAINGTYSCVVTIFGEALFPRLFGAVAAGVTWMPIALAAFGYVVESIRYGCNAVLLGVGDTRILTVSQTMALISGAVLIPLATIYLGLTGAIGAMTAANNTGTLVVVSYFAYFVRRDLAQKRKIGPFGNRKPIPVA